MTTTINTREDALASYRVSPEQVAKCTPVQDGATGQWFYIVESATEAGKEYRVEYNRVFKKLTCTCPAGIEGFSGCWHRRASLAAVAIDRVQAKERAARIAEAKEVEATRPAEESAEQAEIERLVAQGHDRAEATRVIYAKGTQYSERQIKAAQRRNEIAYKPFSLLK